MDSMAAITSESFKSLCQICVHAKISDAIPLDAQISNDATVRNMLESVAPYLSASPDLYPAQVCVDCLHKLIDSYDFQQKILKSRKILTGFIEEQENLITDFKENLSEDEVKSRSESEGSDDEFQANTINIKKENVHESLDDGGEIVSLEELDTDGEIKFEPCSNLIQDSCFKGTSRRSTKKIKLTKLRNVECGVCNKIFTDLRGLRTHFRAHTGERPYLCNFCSKTFADRNCLNVHIKRMHTAEGFKKHQCPYCPQKASDITHLKQHIRTHTGEKPDVCQICGKAFNGKCPLKKHLLWHSEERPWACSFCPQKFKMKKTLDVHQRTHTGVKPYSCKFCDQSFSQHGDMVKHTRTVHAHDTSWQCTVCNAKFKYKTELSQHLIQHPRDGDTTNKELLN